MHFDSRDLSGESILYPMILDGYTPIPINLTKSTMDVLENKYPVFGEWLEAIGFNKRSIFSWENLGYHLGHPFGTAYLGARDNDGNTKCVLYFERVIDGTDGNTGPAYYHIDISKGMDSGDIVTMAGNLNPQKNMASIIYDLTHPKKEKEKIQLSP